MMVVMMMIIMMVIVIDDDDDDDDDGDGDSELFCLLNGTSLFLFQAQFEFALRSVAEEVNAILQVLTKH